MKLTKQQIKEFQEVYKKLGTKKATMELLSKRWGIPLDYHTIFNKHNDIPLSENRGKKSNITADECIEALQQMAKAHPEKIITRNFFRNNSDIAESGWTQHFGTFEEFKRQAGVKLSRHARKMELDIARHASIDTYKLMNVEKRDYEGKYLKPNNNKYETVLVGSDIHDIECCPFWRETFIDTAKRVQPEKIIINGDLFDLPEFGKYNVDPRSWDVVGRIKWVHNFLGDLRKACPEAEMHLIEGNHEYRLLRHLSESTPAMKAILSDLHGFTVAKLLGLDEFEVNYVAPADLGVFTYSDVKKQLNRNFLILYDFLVFHHFPEANKFGLPGVNGHHHKHEVQTHYNPIMGSYEWHQLGAGHKMEASYTNGEKWSNGFCLIHVDTVEKRAQFEYIDTSSNHVVIGGKWYERNKNI